MSSSTVREAILTFLDDNSDEIVVDLTAEFQELKDLIEYHNLADTDPWLGIQFVGSDESPVDIRATNSRGVYRESGVIYLHVVDVAKLGGHNAILNRAEELRNLFRGQRIAGTILIESVSPPNFGEGITLNFEGGYTAALVQIDYQHDIVL